MNSGLHHLYRIPSRGQQKRPFPDKQSPIENYQLHMEVEQTKEAACKSSSSMDESPTKHSSSMSATASSIPLLHAKRRRGGLVEVLVDISLSFRSHLTKAPHRHPKAC
ncbi:hypothetical protein Nepgr_006108 [Nepenthes gracilis]|uniref:Uncharacterized protein n=1 Tax=Nepenthes gracilis TaxID=150966 RepID=A0AAD3S4S9_NEPGR|nr:hypothetical protein Nepgr_006108 [Nepenthes gracilis]